MSACLNPNLDWWTAYYDGIECGECDNCVSDQPNRSEALERKKAG